MGDMKTLFSDAALTSVDPAGNNIADRGGDPNANLSGSSGLKGTPWSEPPVSAPDGRETANSQSGLPGLPSRMTTGATPPQPPDLTDRSPGTIDTK